MCQAFVILSGLILQQGSASSSELHVKSFIVLILSSDFYALHWLPSYPPRTLHMDQQQKGNGSTPDTGWIYYPCVQPEPRVGQFVSKTAPKWKFKHKTASIRFWNNTMIHFQAKMAHKTSEKVQKPDFDALHWFPAFPKILFVQGTITLQRIQSNPVKSASFHCSHNFIDWGSLVAPYVSPGSICE